MKKIILFLKSEYFIFVSVLCVLSGQIIHNIYLFESLRRIDLSFSVNNYQTTALNWIHALFCAVAIEGAILMFLINGKKLAAQTFALASFAINILYYQYYDGTIHEIVSSTLISAMLSGSIWFFSDLFAEKIKSPEFDEENLRKLINKAKSEMENNVLPLTFTNNPTKDYVGKKGL